MAKRTPLCFSAQDLEILSRERYEHPDPRVQQRLEVLWLISQGLTHGQAAKLAGVSRPTAERYVRIFRTHGIEGTRKFHWGTRVSELINFRDQIEESFKKDLPHTIAEACERIKDLTGLERSSTQVRKFLKNVLDMRWKR